MKGFLKIVAATKATAKGPSQAQLLIFGDIGDFGYDGTVRAKDVIEQLGTLVADELLVRINSYGGRVDEGLAIYNAIRAFKGRKVTRVEGIAASIASIIAMAGDQVEVARASQMMIHAASSFAGGTSEDLRSAADALEKTDQLLAEIYSRKTGRTAEAERQLIADHGDRWFTAEEAVAEGYADAIFDPDEQTAKGVNPALCDGLQHHLPTAGDYAPALSARIAMFRSAPPAARRRASKSSQQESRMNWKTLALALGIKLAKDADDAAARAAIAKHFNLGDAATDEQLAGALAGPGDEEDDEVPPAPAPTARARRTPAPVDARRTEIEGLFAIAMNGVADRAPFLAMQARELIGTDPVDAVRTRLQAQLAGGAPVAGAAVPSVQAGADQRDKSRAAAVMWILARANVTKPGSKEQEGLNGNPFRGMNLHDIAREALELAGVSTRRMNRMDVISNAITHSTSDFPNIFENALNKTLLAGFALQKPTWDRFCKVGSLSDFRPHLRYRSGSLGDLQVRQANGEYKSLTLTDAERESITAVSRGGILNVSREMIVNDDMGVFTDSALMLGTSAARTLDKVVFALFALNGGTGPTMGDGVVMFHASHNNIATIAAAPTVTSTEAGRVQMASQLDVSGNDYLDLRPEIWLGPLSVGGQARVVNNSTFDPDANNKLQRANIAANLYRDIIDTPRLTGTAWYQLANPNVEPVFEVGFLDGQQNPQFTMHEAFTQAGMAWRIVHEYGAAGIGFRGIVKNAGA